MEQPPSQGLVWAPGRIFHKGQPSLLCVVGRGVVGIRAPVGEQGNEEKAQFSRSPGAPPPGGVEFGQGVAAVLHESGVKVIAEFLLEALEDRP